jgi:hypothetical protein
MSLYVRYVSAFTQKYWEVVLRCDVERENNVVNVNSAGAVCSKSTRGQSSTSAVGFLAL